jgi:malonate decarboxylase beta subunit
VSADAVTDQRRLLERRSFVELDARARARALLDPGSARELLDPFSRLESPWLAAQGIVPERDDGAIIVRGRLDGESAVIAALQGVFQAGSLGEVSGAKIAGALERALADHEQGVATRPILVAESGGVRLQEAHLGLAAAAEIGAAIVALRRHVPVVLVTAGPVGCFGGMGVCAGLCTHLIATREARLGLNGPEVIEQEHGVEELDASNRPLVWSLLGGEQRYNTGLIDLLVEDDVDAITGAVRDAFRGGPLAQPRSAQVERFLARIAQVDPAHPPDGPGLRRLWGGAR